eukprot:TRINITY_DN38092_c0_g1_i1.p1 TRINITY_DN38092_c0_g1~~TRINITY_DN38092_c0_g1_i1.p1  ORF type:complete len:488 (-),score=104.56 TRINITY_DN38092_c0_g1_i1:262-1725(-)
MESETLSPERLQDIVDLKESLDDLDEKIEKIGEGVTKFNELFKETDRIQSQTVKSIGQCAKEVNRVKHTAKRLVNTETISQDEHLENMEHISKVDESLEEAKQICSRTGSAFLRFCLGHVNVKHFQETDKIRLRDEYNKFRDRTTMVFIAAPTVIMLVMYLLPSFIFKIPLFMFHMWCVYYYWSMSLRTNILHVNGSRIRSWWIWHDYLNCVASGFMLKWEGQHFNHTAPQVVYYYLYLGFVMLLQNRYQRKRHYHLRSLGKVGSMDIQNTHTIIERPQELRILVLFLFIGQVWQFYIGSSTVFNYCWHLDLEDFRDFTGIVCGIIVGLLYMMIGFMNFFMTVTTLVKKEHKFYKRPPVTTNITERGKQNSPKQNSGPIEGTVVSTAHGVEVISLPVSSQNQLLNPSPSTIAPSPLTSSGTDNLTTAELPPLPIATPNQSTRSIKLKPDNIIESKIEQKKEDELKDFVVEEEDIKAENDKENEENKR